VVSCCTCTGRIRAELRRRPGADGVVGAIDIEFVGAIDIDIDGVVGSVVGVPKSIELRLLLGQMLAGMTRPKGVGAASCTGKSRTELRRRPGADGVVTAVDIGVAGSLVPKSIEVLGQMLAGVRRPKGVGAAIGV